ncbi:MAG TPA: RIP metalloprotease RseP [Terriglobales bacterium]|nr:RIP metalloprotease RseP [Terriglobales bacterium]
MLISLISVAVILGFMILIHEFGHYAVAKLLGVRVEQFAIGFGKRLVGFRKGETDYRINAIPLGGYVKMSGENPMDRHTDDPREFLNHSRWHRFLIAIAGPAMNILLAIVLLTGVYMVHYEHPGYLDQPAIVGYVDPSSPAGKAGIQPGDHLTQIDGVRNPSWEQVEMKQLVSANQPLPFEAERNGQTFRGSVVPASDSADEPPSAGWLPKVPVIIGDVEAGMPAAKAGLVEGDKIVAIDGQPVTSIQSMIDSLQRTKEKPLQLAIDRSGKEMTFNVTPVLADTPGTQKHYRLGFKNSYQISVSRLSLPEALDRSIATNRKLSTLILELVGRLVQRKASLKTVSGPIGIAQQAGIAAQQGWMPFLELTAAVSLNLGIFNLLPIPIMDGGVILLLFIESLMRRDISMPIKERIYQAAFVFLVLFAAVVIYNDIVKTLGTRLP